jgi:hypothetical protein
MTDVTAVLTAWNIAVMMEAVRTYQSSISIYQIARRNNPEDSHHLHANMCRKSAGQRISICTK